MRFIVTGIDVAKGTTTDDVSDARPYYELGWEVVTTHFDAKHLKKDGAIHCEEDVIVTCTGREFLYRAEFPQVVNYEEFLAKRTSQDQVISLMERYANGKIPLSYFDDEPDPQRRRYRFYREDAEVIQHIQSVEISDLHEGQPFACFQLRRRAHGDYRNTPPETAARVIEALTVNYHRVFVVGHDDTAKWHSPQVIPVDLQTYASLISCELCRVIFGSFTGPMQLAAVFSKAQICIVMNFDNYDIEKLNNPIMLGACIRYSNSRFLCVPPSQLGYLLEHYSL